MTTTVLAIDQGTSGTKAIVVDPEGQILGLSEVAVHPQYLDGGGVEQDPQALLDSVIVAGNAALAHADRPVDIVTIANQGETVLAWDPDTGRPLSNMIVWQDRRAESVTAAMAEHRELLPIAPDWCWTPTSPPPSRPGSAAPSPIRAW